MAVALRVSRWIVPCVILAFAAVLRFWSLGTPSSLVFDELYYVRDAVSQLAHGFPTVWPDDNPAFDAERARLFGDTASTIAHPPLGKWLIGFGILLAGADSGWGWRLAVAVAGVLTVGATMRLAMLLTRSHWVAWCAGLLLAIDGVHVVLSRVALLDGLLTLFIVLGAVCFAHDHRRVTHAAEAARVQWRRPWLLAAGVMFGAAASIKWSGLYGLAGFLVLITISDLVQRMRVRRHSPIAAPTHPVRTATAQAAVAALITLPVAVVTYLMTWIGWIVRPGGQYRIEGIPWWDSLWTWHSHSLSWHQSLDAPHPYQSHPLTWPLGLRPTAMYLERGETHTAIISPLPNVLVTWAGLLALVWLVWMVGRAAAHALKQRTVQPLHTHAMWVSAFVLTGYLSGWVPWVFTWSRPAVFQFYSVVMTPFSALALSLLLAVVVRAPGSTWMARASGIRLAHDVAAVQGRRIAVAIYLVVSTVLSVLFWPLWAGMPVEHWFSQWHLWLPGW